MISHSHRTERSRSVSRCDILLFLVSLAAIASPCLIPSALRAQEKLVASRVIGVGASWERITFAGNGLAQTAFAGLDSAHVSGVDQFTMPISASSPLAASWRVDVTTMFAAGRVTYSDASDRVRTASLSGLSDVRVRATGQLLHDAVIMTIGVNAPTGVTTLDASQFGALRIVAAPALGLGSPPVGAGLSGTVGIIVAQQLGQWALAYGSSYEARGSYQPIAALTAGSGSADFEPGAVVRVSLGADRLIGAHRLSLALGADVFADDRLRGVHDSLTTQPSAGDSRVRLGPVLSGDVQAVMSVPRLRELLAYVSYRWRAPFARDGHTVERSGGQYLEGGVRAVLPWAVGRDVILASDARWHSGLGVDQGLPTAGVSSAGFTAALQLGSGLLSVQPFVRAQGGSLRQRAVTAPRGKDRFMGVSSGVTVVTRF